MELFSDFSARRNDELLVKLAKYLQEKRSSFSLAFSISLFFHSAVFALFCFSAHYSPKGTGSKQSEQRAIIHAIGEDTCLNRNKGKEIAGLLEGFDISRYNLSEKEKKQLYQKLIASYTEIEKIGEKDENPRRITREDILDFLNRRGGIRLKTGKKIIPSVPADGEKTAKLNVLSKPAYEELQSLQRFPSEDLDYYSSRGNVWVRSSTGTKIVPSQYFFRVSPYEQILAQGMHLFYIVEGFPNLEEKPPSSRFPYVHTTSEGVVQEKTAKGFQVVLLSGSPDLSGQMLTEKREEREELRVSPTFEKRFEKFCDDFLTLPEELQFLYFRHNYLEKYDLEGEDLAYLTRRFIYKNLNNIIIPISTISSAFDYLEELYFNKPLEAQFVKFWRDYPGTSVGAQLLMALASSYEFERRAIGYLYEAYGDAKTYLRQKYRVSEVFNKKTKCYVLQRVFEKLTKELQERGYFSVKDVTKKYIEEQIKIYDMVIALGGKSRNHALYDLACLYWDLNLPDLAIDTWAQIDGSYRSDSLDSIREVLSWLDDRQNAQTMVDNVLNWYATRGVDKRLNRLLELGKWKARGNASR